MFISRLVLKLGLVRFATSLLVVLLASVLNRVLIVDLAVPAALVALFVTFFLYQVRGRPLLPLHDPRFELKPELAEAVTHG